MKFKLEKDIAFTEWKSAAEELEKKCNEKFLSFRFLTPDFDNNHSFIQIQTIEEIIFGDYSESVYFDDYYVKKKINSLYNKIETYDENLDLQKSRKRLNVQIENLEKYEGRKNEQSINPS